MMCTKMDSKRVSSKNPHSPHNPHTLTTLDDHGGCGFRKFLYKIPIYIPHFLESLLAS